MLALPITSEVASASVVTSPDRSETTVGSCNCSLIKISIPTASFPTSSVICHCFGCRASSGGLFSVFMPLPSKDITITQGEPKLYLDHDTGSGRPLQRYFCGNCGSAIFSIIPSEPDVTYVKGGLFARAGTKLPKPVYETWFQRKEDWEVKCEGAVVLE